MYYLGLDIGGANTKTALLKKAGAQITIEQTSSTYFPLWEKSEELRDLLIQIRKNCSEKEISRIGIVMTGELADVFKTRRKGTQKILQAVNSVFSKPILTLDISGKIRSIQDILSGNMDPLRVAATNWLATALFVGQEIVDDCILLDVGSTTTDIIPIKDKIPIAAKSDTSRLARGELIYTGLLRTNLATIVGNVPVGGTWVRVASESFAITADVHLVLNHISPEEYVCDTPNNREKTVDAALNRIARIVCADVETLTKAKIMDISRYIYQEQLNQIIEGLQEVIAKTNIAGCAVLAGIGAEFLGRIAAEKVGLKAIDLKKHLGLPARNLASAVSIAHLISK